MKTLSKLLVCFLFPYFSFSQDFFEPLDGPLGVPFLVMCIDNDGMLYLGNEKIGVVFSNDEGENYFPINSGLSTFDFKDMISMPNGDIFLSTKQKIWKLPFSGNSWEETNIFPEVGISPLFAKNNQGHLFISGEEGEIIKSENSGADFSVTAELNGNIGVMKFFGNGLNFISMEDTGDIYRLSDDGIIIDTLTKADEYVSDLLVTTSGDLIGITSYFIREVVKYDWTTEQWSKIDIPSSTENPFLLSISEFTNGNILISSFRENYISTDGGLTFQISEEPPFTFFNSSFRIYKNDSGAEFLLSNRYAEGLFKAVDGGSEWMQISNDFPHPNISDVKQNSIGDIYLQTSNVNGAFRTADGGTNWIPISIENEKRINRFWLDNAGRIYGVDFQEVLYRSEDEGVTWQVVFPLSMGNGRKTLNISPENNLFLRTENELWKSTDYGENWAMINDSNIGNELHWHPDGSIYTHSLFNIVRSEDEGMSWQPIFSVELGSTISKMHISLQGKVYFYRRWNDPFGGPVHNFYVSQEDGFSFDYFHVPVFPGNATLKTCSNGNVIVGGHEDGVYIQKEGGNWKNISEGTSEGSFLQTIFVSQAGFVYLGFNDDLLYKSSLACSDLISNTMEKTGIDDVISAYPNPTSSEINIDIGSVRSMSGIFNLYNVNGEIVLTKKINSSPIKLSVGTIPNGIYFYEIKTGGEQVKSGRIIYKQ